MYCAQPVPGIALTHIGCREPRSLSGGQPPSWISAFPSGQVQDRTYAQTLRQLKLESPGTLCARPPNRFLALPAAGLSQREKH